MGKSASCPYPSTSILKIGVSMVRFWKVKISRKGVPARPPPPPPPHKKSRFVGSNLEPKLFHPQEHSQDICKAKTRAKDIGQTTREREQKWCRKGIFDKLMLKSRLQGFHWLDTWSIERQHIWRINPKPPACSTIWATVNLWRSAWVQYYDILQTYYKTVMT